MANVGRPPKYETPEQLQAAIDEYFNTGVKLRKVECGKAPNNWVESIPVPTITGLCLYLGFESRQSFYDLQSRSEFSYTIKRARTMIECEYEEMLSTGNTGGAIFALKNMGWSDKTETEHTFQNTPTITFKKFNE